MKLNVRALFEGNAVRCEKQHEDNYGEIATLEAQIVVISETSVMNVRNLAAQDPKYQPSDRDPEVRFGDILAVTRSPDGSTASEVITPGKPSSYYVQIGEENLNLTASFLNLRESLVALTRKDVQMTQGQRRLLMGVQETLEMVSSAPDQERFTTALIAEGFQAAMIDAFGDFEMTVTPEQFALKSKADLLRARIGTLDENHPDSLGNANDLRNVLGRAGVEVNSNGIGAQIRAAGNQQITEDSMRRSIQSNDQMCRKVFGAMTNTPIEKLSAAMISIEQLGQLRENLGDRRLTGDWVDAVKERATDITRGAMGNYSFEMDMFVDGGRDILVIDDTIGRRNGVAFAYSWPTADRHPIMEIDRGRVYNISPEEVPSEEEIERLTVIVNQLMQDAERRMEREEAPRI